MKSLTRLFSEFKTSLYKNYGENPGKMLVHTGALGWVLSSMAQISAIVFNDKISRDQKSFLVPQEAADAVINILSFYVITSSFKNFASKLVSTGKLTTRPIKQFLHKLNLDKQIGNCNFNIEKLANYSDIKYEYKPFKNGIEVGAGVVGSVLSCNIVTPILRNIYASERQKNIIERFNSKNPKAIYTPRVSMDSYQKLAHAKYLKI